MRELIEVWHELSPVWRVAFGLLLAAVGGLIGACTWSFWPVYLGKDSHDAAVTPVVSPTRTRRNVAVPTGPSVLEVRDVRRGVAGVAPQWPAPCAKGFARRDTAIGRDQSGTDRRGRLIEMQASGSAFWHREGRA